MLLGNNLVFLYTPSSQTTLTIELQSDGLLLALNEGITASLVVQMVKQLPATSDTWVQSLGREDSLEKEMATHSSTLAWKIPWMEEPGRLQSMGSQRVRHD